MHTRTTELLMDRAHEELRTALLDFHHMLSVSMPGSGVSLTHGTQGLPGARYRVEARLGGGHPRSPAFMLELVEATDEKVTWSSELQGDGGQITFELTPEGPHKTRLRIKTRSGSFDTRPELEPVAQAIMAPAYRMMVQSLQKTGTRMDGA